MELLTFTIAGGVTKKYQRAGRQLEIIDAPAALNIDLYDESGSQSDEMRGALAGMYTSEPFSEFDVTNPGTADQVVTLMIASGSGGSRRSPGVVRVVDSARDVVIGNGQFLASASTTPGAGKFAQVQVWNGTTDKAISIRQILINATVAPQSVGVFGHNTKLTGVASDVASKKVTTPAQPNLTNIQTVRETTAPGVTPLGGVNGLFCYITTSISGHVNVPLCAGPIVVGPGAGLTLVMQVADIGISVILEGEVFVWYG